MTTEKINRTRVSVPSTGVVDDRIDLLQAHLVADRTSTGATPTAPVREPS